MISSPMCPYGHGAMRAEYGIGHYAPHFVCKHCRKVYVRENGALVPCINAKEHMRNPPPWALVREPKVAPAPAPDAPTAKGFK